MMPYWLRIALGALLGLAAAAALWLLAGAPWAAALAAGLAAPVGFLGSYFLWSADRPEEGYEQVLFDRPNTRVALALLVAFGLAGAGTGLLGGDAPAPTPEQRMTALYAEYQAASDAFARKEADAATTSAAMDALAPATESLGAEIETLPESETRAALLEANEALATAIEAMKACAAGEKERCLDARLAAADVPHALAKTGSSGDDDAAVAPEP